MTDSKSVECVDRSDVVNEVFGNLAVVMGLSLKVDKAMKKAIKDKYGVDSEFVRVESEPGDELVISYSLVGLEADAYVFLRFGKDNVSFTYGNADHNDIQIVIADHSNESLMPHRVGLEPDAPMN